MSEFIWKGRELRTLGNIMDAVTAVRTRDEAREFLAAYRAVNEHADENVGYLLGYLDRGAADRMLALFDVSHPIFGRSMPSAQEAFAAGVRAG